MTGAAPLLQTPGELWPRLMAAEDRALRQGAMRAIDTEYVVVEDAGVPFIVRWVSSLQRKDAAKKSGAATPLSPEEPDLFVTEVSGTHVAILNKFNVLAHHLLILPREFEDQTRWLTASDFEALWACMGEYDALGFYNGGEMAGASQAHKHLQVVPLPLASEVPGVPMGRAVRELDPGSTVTEAPHLPFRHALAPVRPEWLSNPAGGGETAVGVYREMLGRLGMCDTEGAMAGQSGPYNLVVTRRWMLLVPRYAERFEGVSVNALGFAGALLTRTRDQLERIKRIGPMQVLTAVAFNKG